MHFSTNQNCKACHYKTMCVITMHTGITQSGDILLLSDTIR